MIADRARRTAELVAATQRTWGARGVARRVGYELGRRAGMPARAEQRWLSRLADAHVSLRGVRPIVVTATDSATPEADRIRLYGALDVDVSWPDGWHRHPFTGTTFPLVHWAELDESSFPDDIKDLWEIGRLTWLLRRLQRAHDERSADAIWQLVESFALCNPPYLGPHWMCGQESSLRGIVIATIASALADSPASTPDRRQLAADLIAETVGRVRPTLSYALSQRNNHAISEASFLWAATLLVDGLPDADAIRERARVALEESVCDQWYDDGAYAQHSPTYQRLALHGLLFVLAVGRATDHAPPVGVTDAVRRSVGFVGSLIDETTGRMPNLGGNDGALLFDLTPQPIGDFRPLLTHAALATRMRPPTCEGPWDAEAQSFGLERAAGECPHASPASAAGITHHVHRGARSHAVLRAGPIRHRPAHADQLHVDVWIDGRDIAFDAGSYRYSAPPPWANALADEDAHNAPRVPGFPQATRRGRFLWTTWQTATVIARHRSETVDATVADLTLSNGATLRRAVVRHGDQHMVLDASTDEGTVVRWNLPADSIIDTSRGATVASASGWQARFAHGGTARLPSSTDDDPTSGWRALTYAVREPITAIEVRVDESGRAVAWFAPLGAEPIELPTDALLSVRSDVDLARLLA